MPERILVVEDDIDFAVLLGLLLKKKGYEAKLTYRGKEALETAQSFSPDIILQDYMLPDINGTDLLIRLKKTCPETNLIIMTAKDGEDVAVDIMKAGASDYLKKPFDIDKLLITIENTLKLRASQAAFRTLRQELRLKNNVIMALNAISGTFVSSKPASEKYQAVAGIVRKKMKADIANIYVKNGPVSRLMLVASDGIEDNTFTGCSLSNGEGLDAYVAGIKMPAVVSDFRKEIRFNVPVEIHERELVSGFAVPLLVDDTVLGVLSLYYKNYRTFNSFEMKLMGNFANLVALSPRI